MKTKKLETGVERDQKGIPCPDCNGYCEQTELTAEEEKEIHCGNCCGRAFICKVCNIRWFGMAEAPEINFNI